MNINISTREGGEWLEIIIPVDDPLEAIYWLNKHVKPHAINFGWAIWDEYNGWREKSFALESLKKKYYKPKSDFEKLRNEMYRQYQQQRQNLERDVLFQRQGDLGGFKFYGSPYLESNTALMIGNSRLGSAIIHGLGGI